MSYPIYLDNSATTACDNRVVEAMMPYFTEHFGNASSNNHLYGWKAEEAVDMARKQVANLINAKPNEIFFTSGATEANNLAIRGLFEEYAEKGNHIITSNIEHKAVLDTCKYLETKGAEVTYLKVNSQGKINLKELENAIKPSTIFFAFMYANNEIGNINPIKKISEIAKRNNILFFSDAVQAAGKIAIDVQKDGIDVLSITAHKFYGPKGIGAIYIRKNNPSVNLVSQITGGGQERNIRSGTLNTPAIVGFGKACELAIVEMHSNFPKIENLRNHLEKELLAISDTGINGDILNRLPNITNIYFENIEGESLLKMINKTIAVSSGSACSSAHQKPSYVLKALGLNDDKAFSSVRFSLGKHTTAAEIEQTILCVQDAIKQLRK